MTFGEAIDRVLERVARDCFTADADEDDIRAVLERELKPLLEAGNEMYLFVRQGYPSCSAVPKWDAALASKERPAERGKG